MTTNIFKKGEEVLKEYRDALKSIGIIMLILGLLLMIFPRIGSFTIDMFLGFIIALSGLTQIILGSWIRVWKGSLFIILGGIAGLIVGLILLFYPWVGIVTLAFIMGILLIADGIFEIAKSVQFRQKFWKRLIFIDGLFALAIGLLIMNGWPSDSALVLGFVFGLCIFMSGIFLIGLARMYNKK